ncbi:hypothetical protein [Paraconexibacter algicola]|uniref:Coagulation factor 5/8 type domain-containing protein n=1 Tax=Paraconexibacter algicola TaxID=2133960 RepID=A0A2T4UKK9_9ACTN|nr:hypothetical protein [Paraconexibacter algicola]PTL59747.1 hypothetical protein C7Y72_08810 [Paraconexibacter algicola]
MRAGSRVLVLLATAASVAGATAASAAAAGPADRYGFQGGCFTLTAPDGAPVAGPLRFQATRLGGYLLLTGDRRFLTATGDGTTAAPGPSPAGDWTVAEVPGGGFRLSPATDPGRALGRDGTTVTASSAPAVRAAPAEGCPRLPEAELNATGTPARGTTSYGETRGFMDGHMHWMTYLYFGGRFHCGAPFHPYGITRALPDCEEIEGPRGAAAPFQNLLSYGSPVAPHSTAGYPTLDSWSRTNLTYEGTYYKWVERVWMSGMRLMVMGVNENRILCLLQTNRDQPCDEMETVRRSVRSIRQMEEYVDALNGGPGKGWFRIVTDPFEARKVVNAGKMAVVLEMELSEPFGCSGVEAPTCDAAKIDRDMAELHRLGVRSSLLVGKYDNPLGGVRFDEGTSGIIVNLGNRLSAGRWWDAKTCEPGTALTDNEVPTQGGPVPEALKEAGVPGGTLPAYPPGPHCNTRGLTDLGAHAVRRLMERGWIVNPDHMSQAAVDATLTLAEAKGYSGVISPHSWMDPDNWPRLRRLGGLAYPQASSAGRFVERWKEYRPKDGESPFYFGWGFGADLGGLAEQGAPLPQDSPARVTYPFRSLDGRVTFERQRTGSRTFDYAREGVAHYGLYADWVEEVRKLGGPQIAEDLLRGTEAYLQMWERTNGIAPLTSREPRQRLTRRGLGTIRLGATPDALLRAAGQPERRGRAWTWGVRGARSVRSRAVAVVGARSGRVDLVASSAPGHEAAGVRPGTAAGALLRRPGVRRLTGGIVVRRAGATTYAYRVSRGRVQAVGVTTSRAARGSGRDLRGAFAQVPRRFGAVAPDPAVAAAAMRIRPVSETASRTLAARDGASAAAPAFGLVCKLGLMQD